jgi:predicted negative regulator of RcsB-dependent stress response
VSIADRDYILRMIQRMAQALAAVLAKRTEGKTDEALALLERARAEMFGSMTEALAALDASSVTSLLGGMEKARAYATFSSVEGDLRLDRGDLKAAARAHRRALAVYREAAIRFPDEVTDADREAMAKLAHQSE